MLTYTKEEIAKKENTVRVSVWLMVIFLFITLFTGIGTLYTKTVSADAGLYNILAIAHRITAFAALVFAGYNIQMIAPWFFSKTREKIDKKGFLTILISGVFLVLLITIISFDNDGNLKHWIVLHGNAGIGFFISVLFYILLYNHK